MIDVGIVGGAGYTAGELIRILLEHPEVNIQWVLSNSHANEPISKAHTSLYGDTDLYFSKTADFSNIDVVFLCNGHGKSKEYLNKNSLPEKVKIIDLSQDYRHKATADGFVYGLPELNAEAISKANKIANPGCYATAIQLALLPLAEKGLLQEVHVHAITGSTGAGQATSATTHFSWRDNNISVYNVFEHRHIIEVKESLTQLMPEFKEEVNFIPMRGDFPRGILASVYLDCDISIEQAKSLFNEYYANSAFTIISDDPIDLKQVVNTNKCLLHLSKHGSKLHVVSILDNLLKGASGQAIQNMNLMFGLDEKAGLKLKASAF